MGWIRQPQEQTGDYWFAGRCFMTQAVSSMIPPAEINAILNDLHLSVEQEQGLDYLQAYVNEVTKMKIWVIDQVSKNQLLEGDHPDEHNYFTILFPEEY